MVGELPPLLLLDWRRFRRHTTRAACFAALAVIAWAGALSLLDLFMGVTRDLFSLSYLFFIEAILGLLMFERGVAWLLPWLKSGQADDLMLSTMSRRETVRDLWLCLVVRSTLVALSAILGVMVVRATGGMTDLPVEPLSWLLLIALLAGMIPLYAAGLVDLVLRHRHFSDFAGAAGLLFLVYYPLLPIAILGIGAMGSTAIILPVSMALAALMPGAGLSEGSEDAIILLFLALAAGIYLAMMWSFAGMHLSRAASVCVPGDWLQSPGPTAWTPKPAAPVIGAPLRRESLHRAASPSLRR